MWGSSSAGAISKNSTEWPQIDTQCYVHRADPDGILASSERSVRLRRKYLCGVANTSIWWRTSVRQHGVGLARADTLPVRMDSQKAHSALRTQPRGGTGDVAAPDSFGGTVRGSVRRWPNWQGYRSAFFVWPAGFSPAEADVL